MFLSFKSKKIYDLISYFLRIGNNKTLNVCLNDELQNYSKEFLRYFVRGIFDTDGSVQSRRVRVKCISKNLMLQVSDILTQNQIANSLRLVKDKRDNCHDCYEITIGKEQINRFQRIIGLSNPRKLKKLKGGSRDSDPGYVRPA